MILARLLSKADFGLAALFSNTLALLEVASRMSFGQQIVQSRKGESRAFLDTAQGLQLVAASLGVVLILAFSYLAPVSLVDSKVWWAVALLALVPLARGFENLDCFREQRRLNQLPVLLCDVIPQLIVTAAIWPISRRLHGGFQLVLFVIVGKPTLGLLMTHLVAKERFSLRWDQHYVDSMVGFGWPLVLNGILIFASQQADQFLVAAYLSREALATYALAFSIVNAAWAIFSQPAQAVLLPLLSRYQQDDGAFRTQYRACVEVTAVAATCLMVPVVAFGEQMVTVLFGPKYAGTGPVLTLLGAATAVRFLRFTPALGSMARADTKNQLNSNILRAMSLPLAACWPAVRYGAIAIAAWAVIGEVATALFSSWQMERRHKIQTRESFTAFLYLGGSLLVGALLRWLGCGTWSVPVATMATGVGLIQALWIAWVLFPDSIRPLGREVKASVAALLQVALRQRG